MTTSRRFIPGDKLPDADHVLRYIGRKFVDPKDNEIDGNAFLSRRKNLQAPGPIARLHEGRSNYGHA